MLGLLYKDLLLQKKNLPIYISAIILPFIFILAATLGDESEFDGMDKVFEIFTIAGTAMMFMIVGMSRNNVFIGDENKRWAGFVSSSPLGVKGQIGSKYLFMLFIYMAAHFFSYLSASILLQIKGIGAGSTAVATPLMCFGLILTAVEYPFIVAFGTTKGGNVKGLVMIILILIAAVYGLFGDLSKFGSLDDFWEWLFGILNAEGFSNGTKIFFSLFPYISFFLYWLSYRISCMLYLRGAENYD